MNASGGTRQRFPPHTPPSLRWAGVQTTKPVDNHKKRDACGRLFFWSRVRRFCCAKPVACGRTTERARETRLRFPLHTFPSLRPEEIPAAEAAGKRARAGAPSWGFPARFFGNTRSYSRRVLYFSSAAVNRSRLPTVNRRFSCPCRRASSSVQGDGLTGNTPDTPAA